MGITSSLWMSIYGTGGPLERGGMDEPLCAALMVMTLTQPPTGTVGSSDTARLLGAFDRAVYTSTPPVIGFSTAQWGGGVNPQFSTTLKNQDECDTSEYRIDLVRAADYRLLSYPVSDGPSARNSHQVLMWSSGMTRICVSMFVSPRRIRSVIAWSETPNCVPNSSVDTSRGMLK